MSWNRRIEIVLPAALQVQAAYALFLDGRNTGLTKQGFKSQMHDKFAVVLSDEVGCITASWTCGRINWQRC